jgi:hypothetical protein
MIASVATWILIVSHLLVLGVSLAKHGEKKEEIEWNFWRSLLGCLIAITIYYFAGIFKNI